MLTYNHWMQYTTGSSFHMTNIIKKTPYAAVNKQTGSPKARKKHTVRKHINAVLKAQIRMINNGSIKIMKIRMKGEKATIKAKMNGLFWEACFQALQVFTAA